MTTLQQTGDAASLAETLLSTQKRSESKGEVDIDDFGACLVKASRNVLSSMCGIEVEEELSASDSDAQRGELSSVISLSGSIEATIVLNVSREIAIAATTALLGETPESVDENVLDTLGEIANMIGGNAKDMSAVSGASLGLPTIVTGKKHNVALGNNVEISEFLLKTTAGNFKVELAIPLNED